MPESRKPGPHPSYIEIRKQFITDEKIRQLLGSARLQDGKEDRMRIEGVAWLDNVRKALKLPLKTFGTAAVSYHKFRLAHPEGDYNYADAAAASLFVACKIEDTLKRSREVLCAAYNLRYGPAEQLAQDDPTFDQGSKNAIGMERLVLEAIGFDFRSRFPQKLIVKFCKTYDLPQQTIYRTAIEISIDIYRTFAPLKMTTTVMAAACVELASLLHAHPFPPIQEEADEEKGYAAQLLKLAKRPYVMETLLDLLDLYAQAHATTIVGSRLPMDSFISVRLGLNQEASRKSLPRYTNPDEDEFERDEENSSKKGSDSLRPRIGSNKSTPKTPKTPQTPDEPNGDARGGPGRSRAGMKEGTLRYMLNVGRAETEQKIVDTFIIDEIEELEIEEEVRVDRRR